jgi:hypothetical protein
MSTSPHSHAQKICPAFYIRDRLVTVARLRRSKWTAGDIFRAYITVVSASRALIAAWQYATISFSRTQTYYTTSALELTTLEYAIQVRQVRNLHHVALEESFGSHKVFAHRRK